MPVKKLKEFLDSQQVKYVAINHSPAYTAQEIAASAHVRGKELAKTVMVTLDGRMAMAVLPASRKVGFDLLGRRPGPRTGSLPASRRFATCSPVAKWARCRRSAISTSMDVYVSKLLAEDEEIAFNAGSHTELIRLAYKDFERLVKPKAAPDRLRGIDRINHKCSGSHGHACVAMQRPSREDMPTTSVGMAPILFQRAF